MTRVQPVPQRQLAVILFAGPVRFMSRRTRLEIGCQ